MADDLPITDLLRKVQTGDEDAFLLLMEHFSEMVSQIALQKLSKYPRQVSDVGGPSVGFEGLRSTLSYVGKMDKTLVNRNEFFRLLHATIRNKIIDDARRESQEIKNCCELGETDPEGREGTPLEQAIQKETLSQLRRFAVRVAELICQMDNAKDVLIADLGVRQFVSAARIKERLASQFPGMELPSVRAIQIKLDRIRKKLRSELGPEFGHE